MSSPPSLKVPHTVEKKGTRSEVVLPKRNGAKIRAGIVFHRWVGESFSWVVIEQVKLKKAKNVPQFAVDLFCYRVVTFQTLALGQTAGEVSV